MEKQPKFNADKAFKSLTLVFAGLIPVLAAGIFIVLAVKSGRSIADFGWKFVVSSQWNPVTGKFGALSSIVGTLAASFIAMLIAVPMSFFTAFFLVEIASPGLARPVGYAIEMLAAIPSIIFGMWGLFVFAPFMAEHVQPILNKTLGFLPLFTGPPIGVGIMSAGVILALMALPFMTAVMRDILQMTPKTMREAAVGMGATTWEAGLVSLRHGMDGMIGVLFLGLGRVMGETMAVTFVIGNGHNLSASLFMPANTISSTIANEFAEASDPLYLSALMELALILFVITFIVNSAAQWMLHYNQRRNG